MPVDGRETVVHADALDQLLEHANRYRLLRPAEELELAQRIERGDLEAKELLVNSNLRLVVSIARRYQGHGLSLNDIVQEGMLGLIRAAEKFDWRKGFRFSTYATLWIRQSIQRGLDNTGRSIRLPANVAQQARKVGRVRGELSVKLERDPTSAEVADACGLPLEQVERLREVDYTPPSLDARVGDDESATLGELQAGEAPPPEEEVHREEIVERVGRALHRLPEPERKVIELRFGTGGTQVRTTTQVGRELGVTPRTAAELEQRALSRLAAMGDLADLAEAA